ncbi:MAG: tetraacyldisaccharide 4'-kinase [Deltaproteobacteria bacterium]|nr:tetraacyldisaccharide 4'-kinase [Deltaproteobacteria bacterium]
MRIARAAAERIIEGNPAGALQSLPLTVLSFLYGQVTALRNRLYDRNMLSSNRLPATVVSVGNLSAGGTGKTPLAIMIARVLQNRGRRTAVLTRGYRSRTRKDVTVVSDGSTLMVDTDSAGDEAVLLAASLPGVPVLVGRRRSVTGRYALEMFGAEVLILDDGFQHRSLARDLDIVLMDRERPLGNGYLLPRGMLREPPESLKRAQMVVLTGTADSPGNSTFRNFLTTHFPGLAVVDADRLPIDFLEYPSGLHYPLTYAAGKRIVAVAGVGAPRHFKKMIENLRPETVDFLLYPDHHRYTKEDVETIGAAARKIDADIIVATEKDGTKLKAYTDCLRGFYLLRMDMILRKGQDLFLEKLRTFTEQ